MRVYTSGTLLICSVFLFSAHSTIDINVESVMHPFSRMIYSVASFWLNQYLYASPVIYLVVTAVIRPRFDKLFKVDLMHFYLAFSFMLMLDNYLFYDWTLVSVKVYGVVLIAATLGYMLEYYLITNYNKNERNK